MDKIICLGKNYSEHIKEMREDSPERPLLFIKPASSLIEVKDRSQVKLPWNRGLIHHETEIVFKLYKKNVIGLALGLDLTLRELQKELKAKGHPWEIAKTFRNSAVVTEFKPVRDFDGDWRETEFSLKVNGELRQRGKMSEALMGPDAIIHYIDEFFPLRDGDLVFTGTPAGVGPLNPGDILELKFGPISATFGLAHE